MSAKGNPKWIRIILMKRQLTRSNALARSILRIMLFRFLDLIEWMASLAVPMASWIYLFWRKENFSGEIWWESMGRSRFDMIFAMILYRVLQSEMGQKSLKDVGESDFRMRAMKVALIASYNLPEVLHSSTTLRRSFLMRSKKAK